MPPKKEEIICPRNTLRKKSWMFVITSKWLIFACTTTVMSSSIFGTIQNGRLKHRKIPFLFNTHITEYRAAVFCSSLLLEVAALLNALVKAKLEKEEAEEERSRANCHCP